MYFLISLNIFAHIVPILYHFNIQCISSKKGRKLLKKFPIFKHFINNNTRFVKTSHHFNICRTIFLVLETVGDLSIRVQCLEETRLELERYERFTHWQLYVNLSCPRRGTTEIIHEL